MNFIIENWEVISGVIAVLLSLIIKLIPTKSKWINIIDIIVYLLELIPDKKKGGGVHLKK